MTDIDLSDDEKLEIAIARTTAQNRLFQYKPYGAVETLCPDGEYWRSKHELEGWVEWSNKPWQLEYHRLGAHNPERMAMCANGVGKTFLASYEVAMHMTGLYPDWWEGHRFTKPTLWWIGSISHGDQREYTQPAMLGSDLRENLGTGAIPLRLIARKPTLKQAGIPDVVDQFFVKHVSGGESRGVFKAYKQGMRSWMGAPPNGIWLDEQPDEHSLDEQGIYEECQTRVIRTSGIIMVTLTPLLGETSMITHFMVPKAPGIAMVGATWDDVAHLKEDDKARLVATYGKASLKTRTKGVPMMGEGRVFDVDEEEFTIDPPEWEPQWWYIAGMDFGIDHPTAVCWLAMDRDNDRWILLDDYRRGDVSDPIIHLPEVQRRGKWIPMAWPHDGENRIFARGATTKISKLYRDAGFNMLGRSARYELDKGGPQPLSPIIMEMNQRLKTGGMKVSKKCHHWLEEYRSYHYKNGVLIKVKDDALKASFYAAMDIKRCGMQKGLAMNPRAMGSDDSMPLVGAR